MGKRGRTIKSEVANSAITCFVLLPLQGDWKIGHQLIAMSMLRACTSVFKFGKSVTSLYVSCSMIKRLAFRKRQKARMIPKNVTLHITNEL